MGCTANDTAQPIFFAFHQATPPHLSNLRITAAFQSFMSALLTPPNERNSVTRPHSQRNRNS